ncbi:MAG: glycosyltransferase family 4 protein, partial [Planctomycetota bacterium]
MNPVNILFVTTAPVWGGAEIYLEKIIKRLINTTESGFKPLLLVNNRSNLKEKLSEFKLPIYETRSSYINIFGFAKKINTIATKHSVVIVHANGRRAAVFASLANLFFRNKYFFVVTDHTRFMEIKRGFFYSMYQFFSMIIHMFVARIADSVITITEVGRQERINRFA